MLKVLHVVCHLCAGMGGSVRAALQIADASQDAEVLCDVVGTVSAKKSRTKELIGDFPGLDVRTFKHHFPQHTFASMPLWFWLKHNVGNYDVVHSHGTFNFPYFFALKAAIRAGKPLILTPHNSLDTYDLKKHEWWKRKVVGPLYVRHLTTKASVVHCASDLEAQRIDLLGGATKRVIIPYPVRDPHTNGNKTPNGFRTAHGYSGKDFVVLFLSRIDEKKGLELLLQAIKIVSKDVTNIKLAVVGDGNRKTLKAYQKASINLGISDKVRWCGFLSGEAKLAAYHECDLFVLPSYNESFGLVVVEALYCGAPVLISNEVYIWPTLKRRDAVAVCTPTVTDLVKAMIQQISDEAGRREMSKLGATVARTEFGWDDIGERFREVYRNVSTPVRNTPQQG